jgi:type IV secretory pathway TraG/TraD family ATPase VirD4
VKQRTAATTGGMQWLRRSTTTSTETVEEPLLSSTALLQMDKDEVLVLSGNHPPVKLKKTWYFRDRRWRPRAAAV